MPSEPTRSGAGGAGSRALLVAGTAAPPGRLVASLVAMREALLRLPGVAAAELLDLSTAPLQYCDGRRPEDYDEPTRGAVDAALAADVVVLGSPVYRASYAGALKNYLDLLPLPALRDKPVGIVAVGAGDHHYLGVELGLRGVLAWFGALAAPNAVYLQSARFDERRQPREEARRELGELATALIGLAASSEPRGPAPLAARWEDPNTNERSAR